VTYSPTEEYIRRHGLTDHHHHHAKDADVEQSKQTGGMVALYPRRADAELLVVDGGESLDELHCTVIFLGEDVRDQDPTELISHLDEVSSNYTTIEATITSRTEFNHAGETPAAVYLVGGSDDLTPMFREMKSFIEGRYPDSDEQFDPWVPHITIGYGMDIHKLDYSGPVEFDRLCLRWPGHDQDWTL